LCQITAHITKNR